MVFSSLLFLFRFLPLVLIVYYIVPRCLRNCVLLFMSLLFYAWGEPRYVWIMIFSTAVNYVHGILVEHFKNKEKITWEKGMVISSVIINLLILGFFKYGDLLIHTVNQITGSGFGMLEIALPIGVSFYTFQTMSYTIDVYRGNVKAQKNIIAFGTYVTMFPQLIAGPIVKYKTIEGELEKRHESVDAFANGVGRFIIGLGKKVLLANNIGILWSVISKMNPENIPVLTAWLGILAFTFQIYFDFSGYSDMAIGLGKMFGFNFKENFNYPYVSKSITEFFRRWHISLGTWLKEYVYIPLGGNRCSISKHIRNILIVWVLTGLWHGAAYNFILWGAYYGVIIIIEKMFIGKYLERIPAVLSHLYTMLIVMMGWAVFSFDKMSNVIKYICAMFGANSCGFGNNQSIYLLYTNIILLVILFIGATPLPKKVAELLTDRIKNEAVRIILVNVFYITVFVLVTAYLVDATYNPFLYFRF